MDLYEEPYDPQRPTVCFDETSTQLIGESRIPLPARPGRRERFDYEYRRNGTRNLFMLCEPLRGWRHVAVTERRRMGDFAHQMRWPEWRGAPALPHFSTSSANPNTNLLGPPLEHQKYTTVS